MALDPQFTTGRPYVYVLYAYDKAPDSTQQPRWGDTCPTPPGATADGCVVTGRLSRLSATGAETVLIEDFCQQYPSHSVGSLDFGPGRHAVRSAPATARRSTGPTTARTATRSTRAATRRAATLTPPTAQGGALRAQSFRRPAAQPASLDGAILRVNPDTGEASAGNPAIGDANPKRRRIVAYGFRNPFRFTFRPGTSEIWSGDVGWNTCEEINRTQNVAQVRNYGWPCYEGAPRMGSYDNLNLNSCETLYAEGASAVTAPYYAYHHAEKVVPGETCPTGSSSISGLAFYTGDAFPAPYRDALFFADYSRNCIWVMLQGRERAPGHGHAPDVPGRRRRPGVPHAGPGRRALLRRPRRAARSAAIAADNNAPTARIAADADLRRGAAHGHLRRHDLDRPRGPGADLRVGPRRRRRL